MDCGIAARYLKPLHDKHGERHVSARLDTYFSETDAAFVSFPRFVSTYDSWNPTKRKQSGKRDPLAEFVEAQVRASQGI
jgi:hypothetical protein